MANLRYFLCFDKVTFDYLDVINQQLCVNEMPIKQAIGGCLTTKIQFG